MRFKNMTMAQLSQEQRRVFADIEAGPRQANAADRLTGPGPVGLFSVMLRAPGLADHAQKVGAYLRYQSALEARIVEWAIILTGRYWNCDRVWLAHCKLALRAGLGRSTAEAAGRSLDQPPPDMKPDEAVAWRYCKELHQTKQVSDETFALTVKQFGEQGIVDLAGVCGYYTFASMLQNMAYGAIAAGQPMPMPE